MKYVDLRNEQEIQSFEIILPKLSKEYEYFYPDGISKGILWFKKVYFILRRTYLEDTVYDDYYETPQDVLEKEECGESKFIQDGKIWTIGKVIIKLRSNPEENIVMQFKDIRELTQYLNNLESRWGVNLNSYVCLDSSKSYSLYEHKVSLFRDDEE